MSTPNDNVNPSPELETFLEGLSKGLWDARLIRLIGYIGGKNTGKNEIQEMLELGSVKTYAPLGKLLSSGLDEKALTEQQVIAFIAELTRVHDGYYFLEKCDIIRALSVSSKHAKKSSNITAGTPHNLPAELSKTCLQNILTLLDTVENQKLHRTYCCRDLERMIDIASELSSSMDWISQGYQKLNPKQQRQILELTYDLYQQSTQLISGDVQRSVSQLFVSLNAVNPDLFDTFIASLPAIQQTAIKKNMAKSENNILKLIEFKEYEAAAGLFIAHPYSPGKLSEQLQKLQSSLKNIPDNNLLDFLNAVLNFPYSKNLEMGMLVIEACMENHKFMEKHPDLPELLLIAYLQYAKGNNKLKKAVALLVNNPILRVSNDLTLLGHLKFLKFGFPEIEEFLDPILETKEASMSLPPKLDTPKLALYTTLVEDMWLSQFVNNLPESKDDIKCDVYIKQSLESIINDIEKTLDAHHNWSVKCISAVMDRTIQFKKTQTLFEMLSSHPFMTTHILQAYSLQSKENQTILMEGLLKSCASKYNAALVSGLQDIDPDLFNQVISRFKTTDQTLSEKIQKILSIPKESRLIVSDIMEQFSTPFRGMNSYSGQLSCAVTNKRKLRPSKKEKDRYQFNPTVLYNSNFKDYLTLLLSHKPIREKFILAGDHWICGEIEIPENGVPRILIFDSLGTGEPKTHAVIQKQCAGVFANVTIDLSIGKRQKSGLGCTLFTLQDTQELYTIGRYLDSKYNGDIFAYAAASRTMEPIFTIPTTNPSERAPVYAFHLPPRFMRIHQDPEDLEKMIARSSPKEQEAPINIKGETALVSARTHYKPYKDKKTNEDKIRNERLVYKLNKMADNVFDFLAENAFDIRRIDSEIAHFSMEGLKKRLAANRTQEPLLYDFKDKKDRVPESKSKSESEPESKEALFATNLRLIKIFQEKFQVRVIYNLNSIIIPDLVQMYASGEGTDAIKEYLIGNFSTYPAYEGYVNGVSNQVYDAILKDLAILAKAYIPKDRIQDTPSASMQHKPS